VPITTVVQAGGAGVTEVDLVVSMSGMRVTVAAGGARWGGRDVSLGEDFECDLDVEAEGREVTGHLVVERATGRAMVLVDEVDDDDLAYNFAGSPYDSVCCLFSCYVPPGADSLDGVNVTVYRVVEPERPVAPVAPVERAAHREMPEEPKKVSRGVA
jgi:hypothetical protein